MLEGLLGKDKVKRILQLGYMELRKVGRFNGIQ